jgi:hypothetical protein
LFLGVEDEFCCYPDFDGSDDFCCGHGGFDFGAAWQGR